MTEHAYTCTYCSGYQGRENCPIHGPNAQPMTFHVYGPGFEQYPTNAAAIICSCGAPHGCGHAEEAQRFMVWGVRMAEALEEIIERCKRGVAVEIARKAFRKPDIETAVHVQGKGDRVSKVDKWRRLLEQIALSKCVSTMLTGIDRYDDDEQRCGCVVHQARQLVASEAP